MTLTRRQREQLKEADAIANLTQLAYQRIEEADAEARSTLLKIAIKKMVIAEIVTRYTLIDEVLSIIIAHYYFKENNKEPTFRRLWRTKKFQTFAHYILDEIYLLKKMDIVHAIQPLPSDIRKTIQKLNALRNALAHSFFPENRKEHRKNKKVLYAGMDINTYEGLQRFINEWSIAWDYLETRAYGKL